MTVLECNFLLGCLVTLFMDSVHIVSDNQPPTMTLIFEGIGSAGISGSFC